MLIGEALDVHGTIVLESKRQLSGAQREQLRKALAGAWPGRKIVILEDGVTLSRDEQLRALEVKLDAALEILKQLVGALAEDDDGPTHTLDGEPCPPNLNGNDPL